MNRSTRIPAALAAFAFLAFAAPVARPGEPSDAMVVEMAKRLVAEDPETAMKAEAELASLGWPVVRELEILKASKAIPEADRAAFASRAEAVQRQLEQAVWAKARRNGQTILDVQVAIPDAEKGFEHWEIVPRKNPNGLMRKYFKEYVVFATDCTWEKDGMTTVVRPPVMGKVAVRVTTGEVLQFDRDPTLLFHAERVTPASPEEALEAVELFHLLTLDEQFDLERGFEKGLKAGGCLVLQKASDMPGSDKKPLAEEVAARIAPPSCRAVEGGFEAVLCVWYELGGKLLRRTMTFRGGALEVKTEELASRVGSYTLKR